MEFSNGPRIFAIILAILFIPAMYGWLHLWWVFALIYFLFTVGFFVFNWNEIANPKPKVKGAGPRGY